MASLCSCTQPWWPPSAAAHICPPHKELDGRQAVGTQCLPRDSQCQSLCAEAAAQVREIQPPARAANLCCSCKHCRHVLQAAHKHPIDRNIPISSSQHDNLRSPGPLSHTSMKSCSHCGVLSCQRIHRLFGSDSGRTQLDQLEQQLGIIKLAFHATLMCSKKRFMQR